MQKLPKLELRRKKTDAVPLLVLFGVEQRGTGLTAEAYHVPTKTRAGTVGKVGKERYRLPALAFGFKFEGLELSRA